MRVVVASLLIVALSAPALASETMYANDPNRELKEDIEDVYGMYILNPSRRHPKEKVEVKDESVEIWLFHDPRKTDNDKLKCDAVKFLLMGRFGDGGAKRFFAEFPKFNSVELDLYQLATSRTVDKDGKYTVNKTPKTILKVKISRKKSDEHDYDAIAKRFRPDGDIGKLEPDQCIKQAEKLISAKFYSKEFFK